MFRSHPLVWVVFGMLVIVLGWTGLQALGAWWSLRQDDATYGRPRTAQYDVVVGHNDSARNPTHFIALNLHATVEVIELPGGDPAKAKVYQGPQLFGSGADLFPVTLTFPDPTGSGKPAMDIHVQGVTFVYLNQNGQFVPQPSSHLHKRGGESSLLLTYGEETHEPARSQDQPSPRYHERAGR